MFHLLGSVARGRFLTLVPFSTMSLISKMQPVCYSRQSLIISSKYGSYNVWQYLSCLEITGFLSWELTLLCFSEDRLSLLKDHQWEQYLGLMMVQSACVSPARLGYYLYMSVWGFMEYLTVLSVDSIWQASEQMSQFCDHVTTGKMCYLNIRGTKIVTINQVVPPVSSY